jgi:CBS domain-containing protein
MKLAELMMRTVYICRPDDSLAVAAGLLWDHDVGWAPVVDPDGHVLGLITDRDICMATYTRDAAPSKIEVASVMSRQVFSCSPDEALIDAEEVMREHRVRRVPVVDAGGTLVGVLSLNDLAQEAVREEARRARAVRPEEVTTTLAAVGEPRMPRELVPAA